MSNQSIDVHSLREDANELLHTAHVSPSRFMLLYLGISFVLQMLDTCVSHLADTGFSIAFFSVSFFSILVSLFIDVLSMGAVAYALCVCRGENAGYDYLFDGFSFAGKIVLLSLIQGLLIGLGSIFFVFPGILLAYTYALAPTNLCDNPSMGVIAAMHASRHQMDGHKAELFRLHLTFWPQLLLFIAVIAATAYFSPLIASTLTNDALFAAATLLASGMVSLLFVPCLTLATTKFYLLASAPTDTLCEEHETPEA